MYGLTDNIVAGPAGQVVAGAAGSFMAGPAGSFTPAPAGHTPVYPVTAGMPPSGAGYVPIDTTPATIPYAAGSSSSMHQLGGSTQAPIPGPQASVPVSPATGGGSSSGSGGIMYMSSSGVGGIGGAGGGGGGGGGGGAIFSAVSGGAGGGGGAISGGGLSLGGGGGVISGGGGGGISGAGGGTSGGGGGGVTPGTSQGLAPSSSTNSGATGGGGGANSSVSYSGTGFAPMEVRLGQAPAQVSGSTPVSPATPGNPVTPGGHVVPSPVGYLHPPPALRFHAPQHSRISRHPLHVETHQTNTEPYKEYKPSYVWPGRDPADPPPPFLASDFLKPSPYEPPHLLFRDERVGLAMVDASPGQNGSVDIHQNVSHNLVQDFSQTRNLDFTSNTYNDRNVTLDNSITRVLEQSFPEFRQNTMNIVQAQVPALAAQGLEPNLAPLALGGPVMARVA